MAITSPPLSRSECQLFWEVHVPSILSVARESGLSLDAVAIFRITGHGGGEWTVIVRSGRFEDVLAGRVPDPTVTISLAEDVFMGIARGVVDHQEAFFRGDIAIEGDVGAVLGASCFIPFLRERFPLSGLPAPARRSS